MKRKAGAAPSRRPREERVAEIMEAARAEFTESGVDTTSMAQIARRANVVEGSIYRFFDSKHDLLTKVVEHWYEDMLTDYERQLAGISGTRNRLRYMVWRHLQTVYDSPEMCRLMFNHVRSAPDYRETAVFRLNRLYTKQTMEIVRAGIENRELRADLDLTFVRDLIYGGVEHRIWAYLRGEGTFDPQRSADAIVDLVLNGLRASPDQPADQTLRRLEAVADRLEHATRTDC